jgi:hypothetical protein
MKWATVNSSGIVTKIENQSMGNSIFVYPIPEGIDCKIGWFFENDVFYPPTWTSYEFLLRLTPEERADIRERAKTDQNVADFLMLCQSAQEVISNDPITLMGMDYMVAIGVFTEQRKKEILQILE